jgi:hypothetical protein
LKPITDSPAWVKDAAMEINGGKKRWADIAAIIDRHRMIAEADAPAAEESFSGAIDSISVLVKLGQIILHVDEALSASGHPVDPDLIRGLIADSEVREWLKVIRNHPEFEAKG